MNKNILYVGYVVEKIASGADMVNQSNLSFLKEMFKNSLFVTNLGNPNIFEKLFFYTGGCTKRICDDILNIIEVKSISIVFLSSSLLGKLAKKIKKRYPSVLIISFCHNIETDYAKEEIKVKGIKKIPSYFSMSYNESLTAKYSDKIIVLNQRDNELLKKYYKRDADLMCPIVCEDKYDEKSEMANSHDSQFTTLFVGTSFFANVEGIQWYINNVKPFTNDKLIIVGKGMDKFKNKWENSKVEVYGFVDDLSSYYYNADVVVLPIFHGGGMKTKTAEAFMYGKCVVGTNEAFQGYDNLNDKFAICCNDANSFISIISELQKNNGNGKFNKYSREYFLENNTFVSHYKRLSSLFNNII